MGNPTQVAEAKRREPEPCGTVWPPWKKRLVSSLFWNRTTFTGGMFVVFSRNWMVFWGFVCCSRLFLMFLFMYFVWCVFCAQNFPCLIRLGKGSIVHHPILQEIRWGIFNTSSSALKSYDFHLMTISPVLSVLYHSVVVPILILEHIQKPRKPKFWTLSLNKKKTHPPLNIILFHPQTPNESLHRYASAAK